jgi:hypothetical protein
VITLVMLAIVTVMAIIFLSLSRRERASVKVSEDIATANMAADAALQRAKAQAIARMEVTGSKLHYDLFNSTNFVSPNGFKPQSDTEPNPSNVDYFDSEGNLLPAKDRLQVIANLMYDARPPVFIETNTTRPYEFRYYLDFDRNRGFEPTGLFPEVNTNGQYFPVKGGVLTNRFVGDPQWIGILERPDLPHSETNRFIARMAYLAMPVGKTLDLNFIHNQADEKNAPDDVLAGSRSGFARNQGYGSWEINLAAFLRELNTNNYAWGSKTYDYRFPNNFSQGQAFDDARSILDFRYTGRRSYLSNSIGSIGLNNFANDFIDNYGDGPISLGASLFDNDDPNRPWPGSLNTNAFTDVQELFNMGQYSGAFIKSLQTPMEPNRKSTYDRYTFYRLLSQMGVDSDPAIKGKLNLNYANSIGEVTNNLIPWTNAIAFFTNAAELMLQANVEEQVRQVGRVTYTNTFLGDTPVRTNFSLTNILIYALPRPVNWNQNLLWITNEYTAATHRILQLAANIFDNMTNQGAVYPHYPTVLRPFYSVTTTNLSIAGYLPVTNINQITNLPWVEPLQLIELKRANPARDPIFTNVNVYGQAFIVGAKKGHPNFNEFSLETVMELSRKIELGKRAPGAPVTFTNQQFIVNLETRLGMEAWNSYTNNYTKKVNIFAEANSLITLSNRPVNSSFEIFITNFQSFARTEYSLASWPGTLRGVRIGNMQIPINTNYINLPNSVFTNGWPYFFSTTNSPFQALEDPPNFVLYTTNRVRFWITEEGTGRIIDFVNLDNLRTRLDVGELMRPNTRSTFPPGSSGVNPHEIFWDTNRLGNSGLTVGIMNQLAMSRGDMKEALDNTFWKSYRFAVPIHDREHQIDLFRVFSGTNQLYTRDPILPDPTSLVHQAPFVPTRRVYARYTWQANDPLVHYMDTDLFHPGNQLGYNTPDQLQVINPPDADISKLWNIGRLNERYRPWGGNPGQQPDTNSFNLALKDPNVRRSDDWRFPIVEAATNYFRFPSIGWLGRVHRGTPWQTIYMKSIYQVDDLGAIHPLTEPVAWYNWAGSVGNFPSQDYKIFDVFTVAPNENAARGLLSVNQKGLAAWSAVLSGVSVYTNIIKDKDIAAPNAPANPYTEGYTNIVINPATPQVANIVAYINWARTNQFDVTPIQDASRPLVGFAYTPKRIAGTTNFLDVFEHVGDVLSAPGLTVQSPFLRSAGQQVPKVWVDEAVERIPQQIMSLLKRDEPKFVVYSFGQSLRPAPHSLVTSADFYNLCTNYQITGEVITKTTFRVEGELRNPNNPLRAVVESYNVLPPPE